MQNCGRVNHLGQGIRSSRENNDVIIFVRKINNDSTTYTLSQPELSSHYFFRSGQLGNVESLFFRQKQVKGRVIIFPQLSSHCFWQHSACAWNTVMEEIIARIRWKASPSMSSHYFFRPGQLGKVESLFFSRGPAMQCQVIIFSGRTGWAGPSHLFFRPFQK